MLTYYYFVKSFNSLSRNERVLTSVSVRCVYDNTSSLSARPYLNDWSRLSFQSRLCLNETIHFVIDSGMYTRLLAYAI